MIRHLPLHCAPALTLAVMLAGTGFARAALATDGTWDASWIPHPSVQKGIPGLIEDTWNLGGTGAYAGDMTAAATVVQNDGKVLVAGFGWNTFNGTDQNACVVRRYNADGSVDTGFGTGGAVVTNWHASGSNPKLDCYAKAIALQPDGKIVYAGQLAFADGVTTPSAMVARLNLDGTSDTSFVGGGFAASFARDANSVAIAGNGQILVAGSWVQAGFTDTDFYFATLDPNGNRIDEASAHWDVPGSDKNEFATSAVLESSSVFFGGHFHQNDELYLVGVVDDPAFASGQVHRSCGIAAFHRTDGGTFTVDTGFNGSGRLSVDFPVGIDDTDTICRTATYRPSHGVLLGPTGVVVGGERYYTPNGAPVASASYYALAEVDSDGAVTRHDDFAFFADLNEAGAFNSIFGMTWDNLGKLVVAGYAGIGANGDQTHAPSDGVVRRFNADFTVDGSFAADHSGTLFASLDSTGSSDLTQAQREWANAIAFDPLHGRVVFVGERSIWMQLFPNLYSWFLGAVHDGNVQPYDRIFANGFD